MVQSSAGPRWPSDVITYSFAQSTYGQDVFHPFDAALDTAAQAVVNQAIQNWEQVSGLTFVEVPDSSNPAASADIRIGWTNLDTAKSGVLSRASWTSHDGVFNPDVVIQLENPAQTPLTGPAGDPVYQDTSATLLQVAMHEIGRAIGLPDNHAPGSVMDRVVTSGATSPDSRDIAEVQALYPPPLVPVFISDATTGTSTVAQATRYVGPDTNITAQYVCTSSDNVNIGVATPGVWLVAGSGNDALAVASGNNLLQGGAGSDYLVGGTGTDTFSVQAGTTGASTWDTIVNFHQGEMLTVYGLSDPNAIGWVGSSGAPGSTGATFQATAGNGATIRVTFAGLTPDAASLLAVRASSGGVPAVTFTFT
jgi:hypothetical protein